MAPEDRIVRFVSTFLRTMGAAPALSVPDDMLDSAPDQDGWSTWKAIESPVTHEMILDVERRLGHQLPRLLIRYLTYKCLLMTDFGTVSLPEIRSDDPLREIERFLALFKKNHYLSTQRFFPIGTDSRTGHLICLALGQMSLDGDCPVMDLDLQRVAQAGYTPRLRNSSVTALFDEIETSLLSYQ